jgi:hypothetical protein
MAISFVSVTEEARPEITYMHGDATITMEAGKSLKIKTSPEGEKITDIECPVGKEWNVIISVDIIETEAEEE